MPASLIALDWGTSSLRAYRMDSTGGVLDSRRMAWGIMNLPPALDGVPDTTVAQGFERAFDIACGDWLRAEPDLPVIACGMVGSAQGWVEAAYLDVPTRLDDLAAGLVSVNRGDATSVRIIPGLIDRRGLPNVMRGEETQVAGVLASLTPERLAGDVLIGLPGTHSKWVTVQDGEVIGFDTFMTGEIYAAVRGHTILARTMQSGDQLDQAAFVRGLEVARSEVGRLGVLSNLFSCRTLGLTGVLTPTEQADYLSGLLVGHEIKALADLLRSQRRHPYIVMCGESGLCERYMPALELNGMDTPVLATDATEHGLWNLAVAADLPLSTGSAFSKELP